MILNLYQVPFHVKVLHRPQMVASVQKQVRRAVVESLAGDLLVNRWKLCLVLRASSVLIVHRPYATRRVEEILSES